MAVNGGREQDAKNKKLGKLGEKKARSYLRKNGWKTVEKNYVNPFGEVDIIARKGDEIGRASCRERV